MGDWKTPAFLVDSIRRHQGPALRLQRLRGLALASGTKADSVGKGPLKKKAGATPAQAWQVAVPLLPLARGRARRGGQGAGKLAAPRPPCGVPGSNAQGTGAQSALSRLPGHRAMTLR